MIGKLTSQKAAEAVRGCACALNHLIYEEFMKIFQLTNSVTDELQEEGATGGLIKSFKVRKSEVTLIPRIGTTSHNRDSIIHIKLISIISILQVFKVAETKKKDLEK